VYIILDKIKLSKNIKDDKQFTAYRLVDNFARDEKKMIIKLKLFLRINNILSLYFLSNNVNKRSKMINFLRLYDCSCLTWLKVQKHWFGSNKVLSTNQRWLFHHDFQSVRYRMPRDTKFHFLTILIRTSLQINLDDYLLQFNLYVGKFLSSWINLKVHFVLYKCT
jgi:hypothetical protein